MNWDHLRALIAVSRAGSLSAAAQALGVRHSTVGRHLLALERDFGAKLVQPGTRGMRLTVAGQRLLEAAEQAEAGLRSARNAIGAHDIPISGVVRVGAPEMLGSCFLAARLAQLTERHRELTVQLVATSHPFNLPRREADLVIALSEPNRGRVVAHKLADYDLGIYGSEAYLAQATPIRAPDDLKTHRFIGYIDDLIFASQLNYLDDVAAGARARFQSSSLMAQLTAARAGAGLCVLPHFLARQFLELHLVLPDTARLRRTWWLLVHEEQQDVARVRHVIDFITDEMARYPFRLLPSDRHPPE